MAQCLSSEHLCVCKVQTGLKGPDSGNTDLLERNPWKQLLIVGKRSKIWNWARVWNKLVKVYLKTTPSMSSEWGTVQQPEEGAVISKRLERMLSYWMLRGQPCIRVNLWRFWHTHSHTRGGYACEDHKLTSGVFVSCHPCWLLFVLGKFSAARSLFLPLWIITRHHTFLGVKLGSSCLSSKRFTRRASFRALGTSFAFVCF